MSLERAGYRCELAVAIPEVECSTYQTFPPGRGLEVDEVEGRGAHPGTQYVPEMQQVGCSAHHQWKTEHPAEAEERGLRRKSSYERRRNERLGRDE